MLDLPTPESPTNIAFILYYSANSAISTAGLIIGEDNNRNLKLRKVRMKS